MKDLTINRIPDTFHTDSRKGVPYVLFVIKGYNKHGFDSTTAHVATPCGDRSISRERLIGILIEYNQARRIRKQLKIRTVVFGNNQDIRCRRADFARGDCLGLMFEPRARKPRTTMDDHCRESDRIQHVHMFVNDAYSAARSIQIWTKIKDPSASIGRGGRNSEARRRATAPLSVAADLARHEFCPRAETMNASHFIRISQWT